jgi:hypothetical protein
MELIIKLNYDKPARVGIKYIYDYLAVRSYEEIFNKQAGQIFTLKLEPAPSKVDLTLTSEETGIRIHYPALDYKIGDLQKLQLVQQGSPMEFVHIFPRGNSLFIAKPFKKETFIQISECQVISPGNFSGIVTPWQNG